MLALIALMGVIIGRVEGWTHFNALYYAFITATTVGYGDLHPKRHLSKVLAIFIALTGLLVTGFFVTIGISAATFSFKEHNILERFETREKAIIKHPLPLPTP